jgi:hypothetical protein
MTLPTFFIIGAAKTGTTSLHYYLDQHPQIQMSANKEPCFFSGPENGIPYPMPRVSRLEDYERLFDGSVAVRGEASVAYANHPRREGVPQRIKELVPDAKFIYMVRDPVERTVSHYQQLVAVGGERRTLAEVLGDLSDPRNVCICPSLYATQLELYLQVFPQERLLVLEQGDLLADRRSVLAEIFRFLEVDDVDSERFHEELGTSRERRVYPRAYTRMLGPTLPAAVRWIPRPVRHSLRLRVERLLWPPLKPTAITDDLRARLEERYAGEAARLRELTGRSFSNWSV